MKTDLKIKKDVEEAFRCEDALKSSEIEVSVNECIVTLSGMVNHYSARLTAEEVAKNVSDVKEVTGIIHIGLSHEYQKADIEFTGHLK